VVILTKFSASSSSVPSANPVIIPWGGGRVIASYLLQKIQTKREKYSVKKKQSSKRRKGYYLKKVSE
jgi:hypothetical protein